MRIAGYCPALHDNSTWQYDYNDRSELIAGKRFWNDWTPVSGQQFEYGYDPIGNRTVARSGGDEYGQNLRETTYGANELNQYSVVTNSPYAQVTGFASATASVSVNSSAAYERDEYFHRELPVSNGSGPIAQSISAVASLTGTNATETGSLILAKEEQDFTYDLDGNLTDDGIWSYEWDGENRLKAITMTSVANVVDTNRFRLEFSYDFQGRRLSKTVYNWNSSTNGFLPVSTNLFIYDGWNLLAELDGGAPLDPLPLVRSYAWGLDLADSFEEAGGIGGLLAFTDHAPLTDTYHYPAYDGNGNVTGLVQSSGSPSALYEYSPFGELIRSTGPAARLNLFQFSTKYLDQETGLSYYGHRYYSASLGRWMSRDPIEEEDGPNVYAFVRNQPLSLFDALGLTGTAADTGAGTAGASGMGAGGASQAISILRSVEEIVETANAVQELGSALIDLADGGDLDFGFDAFEVVMNASRSALSDLRGPGNAAFLGILGDDHHIATDKNYRSKVGGGPFTPKFNRIFAKAGMHLQMAINRVNVPGHRGPHPKYNALVYKDLTRAIKGAKNKKQMAAKLTAELLRIGKLSQTPGTKYNRLLTGQ